jgi:hypothetical protein
MITFLLVKFLKAGFLLFIAKSSCFIVKFELCRGMLLYLSAPGRRNYSRRIIFCNARVGLLS